MSPRIVYQGPLPYEFKDWEKLGGRDNDTRKLFTAVKDHIFTLIYGRSGVGKTSLIRAGLNPELGDHFFLPIVIRLNYAKTDKSNTSIIDWIHNRINQSLAQHNTRFNEIERKNTLWSYFQSVKLTGGLKPVLIIDQFEEILHLIEEDHFVDITIFLKQLSNLSRNKADSALYSGDDLPGVNYRFVVSMRSDYLDKLPIVEQYLPIRTENQFLISYITGEQALEAIQKPARTIGQEVDEEVAIEIIRRVVKATANEDDSIISTETSRPDDWRNEPVNLYLLSLYCFKLNEKCEPKDFSFELLDEFDLNEVISTHYSDALTGQEDIEKAIETHLISKKGVRLMHPADNSLFQGYENRKVKLIEQRIIQEVLERRGTYAELVHDRLAKEALKYKQKREAEAAKKKLQDDLEEEKRRLREIDKMKRAWIYLQLAFIVIAILLFAILNIDKQKEHALKQKQIAEKESRTKDLTSYALFKSEDNPRVALNLIQYAREIIDDEASQRDVHRVYSRYRFSKTLNGTKGIAYGLQVLNTGKNILSTSDGKDFQIVDTSGIETWDDSLRHSITALTVASNNKQVAFAGHKGQLTFGNLGGKKLEFKDSLGIWITDLAFSQDGKRLYGVSRSISEPFKYNIESETLEYFESDTGHSSVLWGIETDEKNNLLYAAGFDGAVKSWTMDGALKKKSSNTIKLSFMILSFPIRVMNFW